MTTMNYEQLIEQLTPEIYERFKRAIEIGKWPDGSAVSAEQKAHCMEAVIAYEAKHMPEEQRTGYIDRGTKKDGEMCGDDHNDDDEKPLTWH